jgi:hypothetical protein
MRHCDWCGKSLEGKRSHAITCSKLCRQRRARFRVHAAGATAGRGDSIRCAYADPPYPKLARKYYGEDEVDHEWLIQDRLVPNYPDGWALSTSAQALPQVLRLCPEGVRVCSWDRGRRSRPGKTHRAHNVWEPLIVWGGRPYLDGAPVHLLDALRWGGRQHSYPGAQVGMKPAPFCEWMFRQLGLRTGDELDDLYPGSGAVMRAWILYTDPNNPYAPET